MARLYIKIQHVKILKKIKPKTIIFIGFRHKKNSIQTAKEEGFKVVLLTRKTFEEAKGLFDEIIEGDLLNNEFIEKIIPILKQKYLVKGIVSNYEHYVVTRSYLAERFSIPSSTVYSAACTRNKVLQRHALKFMKENIDSISVKTEKEALDAFKKLDKNVFIKSIAGIKSIHVFHCKTKLDIKKAFKALSKNINKIDLDLYDDYKLCNFDFEYPSPRNTFIVEKAAEGQQVSTVTLAGNYNIWSPPSVLDIYPASELGFKDSFLAFRILPSKLPSDIILKAKRATIAAVRILGMRHSAVHTELMVDKDNEIKIIETASRMGGYRETMYRNAYGIELSKLLVKSIIGKDIKLSMNPLKKPLAYVSMMEIYAKKEGLFKGIKNIDLVTNDSNINNIEILPKTGDNVGPAKFGFWPCLRFLIKGKIYEEVYEKSIKLQKIIHVILE